MTKTERYIILKMAELVKDWKEPFDKMDYATQENNAPLEQKFNFLKELLKDHWAGNLD